MSHEMNAAACRTLERLGYEWRSLDGRHYDWYAPVQTDEAEPVVKESLTADVPAGYRLQPLSEYEAFRYALDLPEGDFPKWKEALIAEMQSSYDTDGITHEDSGDPLIYLQSAIAIVEDFELVPVAASAEPVACQTCEELRNDLSDALGGRLHTDDEKSRMIENLIEQLAAISEALGISDEDQSVASGVDEVLFAIEELRAASAERSAAVAATVALAEKVSGPDTAKEIQRQVIMRENACPHCQRY